MKRELDMVRARNAHPLMPKGTNARSGVTVQALETLHGLYLPDALFRWYWIERRTICEIADDLGIHFCTVSRWLKQLGLNQKSILDRAARQLQEDPGWALERHEAWRPPRG